jgi:hypothetical protein
MGTERGLDWRIQIGDGGGPEVFTNIGGEITFDWKRSSEEIDESTKDDGIYGSSSYGQQKITISASGNVKLPDTGLEGAFATSKAAPPEVSIKIVRAATTKFAGKVAIGNFSTTHNKTGPVTWSFDMVNVGAPTTDDLGA